MGTTVGKVLISYDVSAKNPEVKAALIALGYHESFKFSLASKVYQLPNTTLWHKSKSSDQAMSDMKNVCITLNVKLEKAIAVRADEFVGL